MRGAFAAEMVGDPPPVPPADAGNDQTTILPLDADPGPPDLDAAVQSVINDVTERALTELDGTDRQLHPGRSKVRASLAPVLAHHAGRLADIRNRAAPPGPPPADGGSMDRRRGAGG